jgi:hypothetical protein
VLSPAEILSTLVSNTIIGGASGWTRYIGNLPGSPDKVAAFMDSGGLNPWPHVLLDFPSVQVVVRGPKDSYGDAYAKARQIRDALLGLPSQDIVSEAATHRLVSVTMAGDIASIGNDTVDRPLLSINFRTIWEPPSGANREAL